MRKNLVIGGLVGLAALAFSPGCNSSDRIEKADRTNTLSLKSGRQTFKLRDAAIDDLVANGKRYRSLPRDCSTSISYQGQSISDDSVLDFILTPKEESYKIRTENEVIVKPVRTIYLVQGEITEDRLPDSPMEKNALNLDYNGNRKKVFVVDSFKKLPETQEKRGSLVEVENMEDLKIQRENVRINGQEYMVFPTTNPFAKDQFVLMRVNGSEPLSFEYNNTVKNGQSGFVYIPVEGVELSRATTQPTPQPTTSRALEFYKDPKAN